MHASKKTQDDGGNSTKISTNEHCSVRETRSALSPQKRVGLTFPAIGRTKQDGKDACDVNLIMHRFTKLGVLEHVNKFEPQYAEHTGIDFQEAINLVQEANDMFAELPSKTRAVFENNPALFMDWVQDPDNLKLLQTGTAEPEPPPVQNKDVGTPLSPPSESKPEPAKPSPA